jgi:hypothetical protein
LASKQERKVYDYDKEAVRTRLISGFSSSGRESTVADLAGLTGLPLAQIEAELPSVADEFGARLKVTEKGEILYSFPSGFRSRYRGFGPAAKRTLKALKKGLIEASKAVFKLWIMGMLVGYFVLFLALALFALLVSFAAQQGGGRDRDNRRGGGLGGLWLTTRLFDSLIRIWFYSEFFKSPETRYRQAAAAKARRPLHKAVFSHVFGDGDPDATWPEVEKKAVLAFLQTHGGVMSLAEFMAITGQDPAEAELAINRYLVEFEGSPEVTSSGSIYYSFPRLLSRLGTTPEFAGSSVPLKRLERFSSNEKKADRTFRLVNIFNLVFGGYFLYNALTLGGSFYMTTPRGLAFRGGLPFLYSVTGYLFGEIIGMASPVGVIGWGLGIVPLAFSALFFGIPLLRSARLTSRNERRKFENLRRIVYRHILSARGIFRPESVSVSLDEARPADSSAQEKITKRLAAWSGAEPREGGYEFSELTRIQDDIAAVRDSIDSSSFLPGKTVFDTEDKA